MKDSIYNYIYETNRSKWYKRRYKVFNEKTYFSKRYGKHIDITVDDPPYDGASGAKDINSFGWLFHDVLKRDKKWSDGTRCSNSKASWVLYDILKSEGRWFRARTWYVSTLAWGAIVK
ncbi:MAG: hypothetical protein V3R25_05995 [Nitrosomonadaceae bacterium]